MTQTGKTPFSKNHLYLIILLIASTVVTMLSTVLTYKNALNSTDYSLKLQALGISVSLEASLKNSDKLGQQKNIFKEIITDEKWEGIAFIGLYDKNGMTLLHSNENLIGRQIQDENIERVANSGIPVHEYSVIGTGEKVFIWYSPLHIQDKITDSDINEPSMILRIALHTYPVEKTIREARLQVLSISSVVIILWITGYFFMRASRRAEILKNMMLERERFAVIGELASVLAHEIRNPLGSIKGFAQYIKERNPDVSEGYLDIIISESERLETLTDDLLVYARPVEIKKEEFIVSELLYETVKSIQVPEIKINISSDNDIKIKTDRDKLKQILLNIIKNSLDSIESLQNEERALAGVIDIKTERIKDNLVLSISDNGCGMSRETILKAFIPFFTTKTKGTGLGLAIVDKLIKAIGGKIEIKSELLKGTVFKLILPLK